jgi:general secretion pathway protein B
LRRIAAIDFGMSFILDALRKSENARLRQEHPAMFDARAVASRRAFPIWGVALGLLLGVNLLVVLTVLLRNERAAAVADAPLPVSASSPAPVPAPQIGTVAAPMDAAPAATRTSAAPPAAARTAALSRSTATTPARTAPSVIETDVVPTATSAPIDLQQPSRTRDDLLAAGDAIPEAALSLHVYDPDVSKRFILLNGQRLREGEMAGNGLRVRSIVPDGAVLDHRGATFKVSIEP